MKVTNYQEATIDPFGKGLGNLPSASVPLGEAGRLEWNLLAEDVSLPAAVLYEDRIEHNLNWMQAFVQKYGVKFAPHGKTTMAPQLFRRQLDAGACITLATAHQTQAAYHGGVRRVLLANQLVGRQNMTIIAGLLSDPDFGILLSRRFGGERRPARPLLRCAEEAAERAARGVPGGRAGVRDAAQREAVLAAIARYPDTLKLAGIELYEGVLKEEGEIRTFLQEAVALTRELAEAGRFARTPAILSGAGSAWYDVVAGIREGVERRLRGSRAASGLLPDARCRHLQEGADRRVRAQPDRTHDGRRAAPALQQGLRAVGAGGGPRDRRARQARRGVRRGLPEPARHFRRRDTRRATSPPPKAGPSPG